MGGGGAGYYKNSYQHEDDYGDDDDDEGLQEYGREYYAEESDEDDSGDAHYMQNYPPGAMFQGGAGAGIPGSQQAKVMAAGMKAMGAGGYGGVSSASGVPFYGQQNKMNPQMGYGAGVGAFGSVSTAGGIGGGGGGFTYGMASKGGNLFGPPAGPSAQGNNLFSGGTQFGAGNQANAPGLFQFGSVSQFGGLGGASSLFGGPAGGAAAASDDPYANIALDLNKVKKSEPPPKLYEHKTEEEKKKESISKGGVSSVTTKSNLKKDSEDKPSTATSKVSAATAEKRNVTFGKSTTYEVDHLEDDSGEFNTKDAHKDGGKGSPRPEGDKKVISEKDLSDGRSEKEKILEMLERQQREQIEEIQEMNNWKQKVDDKKPSAYDDSVGESSSSNQVPPMTVNQLQKKDQSSGSYESDDFEDVSASGSGSKQKLNYWPQKNAGQKTGSGTSSAANQYDPSAMDEYLKKQKQMMSQGIQPKPATQTPQRDPSESSDKYDEDFESVSRSQSALPSSFTPATKQPSSIPQKPQPFDYKPVDEYKSSIQKYIKKENAGVQTDEGKYSYMQPGEIEPSSYKEWTLTQNLKDAEDVVRDLKSQTTEYRQKVYDAESALKKKDVEFQTMRRDALNAQETSKRLQEQLKDSIHKNNLYKIETEELIKQIDLADAKAREKEDELRLCQAEYERKLKLQEERILFRQSKQEQRDTYELKHQHMVEREEMQRKVEDMKEEIDYYTQKVAKIESENMSLRLGKDQNKRVKELEEQVETLKNQLSSNTSTFSRFQQAPQESTKLMAGGKELSKDEQLKLQREVQQLELMLKGYQEESEKYQVKFKGMEKEIKGVQEKLLNEQKRVKELQQKALLDSDKVYVEEKKEELVIDTVNLMGLSNAISQKQLTDLHSQVQKLQNEKLDVERDLNLKEGQLKAQVNKVRDEKATIEKQLYDTEFLLGERDREVQKLKDEFISAKEGLVERIRELEDKVTFFRQNQKLLTDSDEQHADQARELVKLKEKVQQLDQEAKKSRELEKKCKLLEETIKAKNPNSIPMMLQQVKEQTGQEKAEVQELRARIKQLEMQIDENDKDFEKRIRTLRQEAERVKEKYEGKKGSSAEAKKVAELEHELETTKAYYNKRIREIEEKNKYKVAEKRPQTAVIQKKQSSNSLVQQPSVDTKNLEDQIDKLMKERNLLAQKVVNLETQNNKKRSSFRGEMPIVEESKHAVSAIYSIASLIKSTGDKQVAMNLIESALSCVEQLRQKDASLNGKLSQLLLALTQDLNATSRVNVQILNDILDTCRPDTLPSGSPDFKKAHSQAVVDKDLIQFYPSPEQASHRSKLGKPPKPAGFKDPFSQEMNSPPRPVRDILKQIIDIDFERHAEELNLNPRKVPINQVYNIIKEEAVATKVTLDEVRNLIGYVKEKSGVAENLVTSNDEIDLNDLLNAILDASIDGVSRPDKAILNETGVTNRYSAGDRKQQQQVNGGVSREDYNAMQQQAIANIEKVESIQRVVYNLQAEKRELVDKVEKLEQGKVRLEKILKQQLNKTNGQANPNAELIEELQVLTKRIEYMEQQSDERHKSAYMDHNLCTRQIKQLQQDLEHEKNEKVRMLSKKNSEVAYFKAELEGLLGEIQATSGNKKRGTFA